VNENNVYNHNFMGKYCTCEKPYPDPEDTNPDEMVQCVMCEDWHHNKVVLRNNLIRTCINLGILDIFSIWARHRHRIRIILRWSVMLAWRSILFLALIRRWLILPRRHRPANWRVKPLIQINWTLIKQLFGRRDGEIDFADAKSV
jgi:hypothetical protein